CIILTLCLALPTATNYPLLKLLADCNTSTHHPPPPTPAPRKTCGHRLQSECVGQTQVEIQCGPWTVKAGQSFVDLHTTTLQGVPVTVTIRL
uniref:Probable protein E4 n=1 Tax=Macaca mulata papillomavirus 1 TaxID=2779844 RepID=VE4_MMPV1|nr:RecName: Full=Probable protein E4 [Macaca mulata papillomavirus 1]